MLDKEQKLQILEKIIASPEFRESKRYQDLLLYLFECTEQGQVPKEITLATQFFGRSGDFDPKEDTSVRVHINSLRKKLEHYYFTSEHQPYQLIIPKGRYQVDFVEWKSRTFADEPVSSEHNLQAEKNSRSSKYLANPFFYIASILIFFILGAASVLLFRDPGVKAPDINNPVWIDFLEPNGRPVIVVLGDFYFLFEKEGTIERGRFVRDVMINSSEDYKQRIRKDAEFAKKYIQSDFTFLRPSASWGLSEILPYLGQTPKGYTLKLASQFSIEDARKNNIIYIGSFKNLFALNKLLHIFNLSYELSPAGFSIKDKDTTRFFSPSGFKGGNVEHDYSVVAKARGPEGSTIMLLMGFGDTGVIEAARFVSEQENVKKLFGKSGPSDSPFFTAVVETEGINQSIFKTVIHYTTTK